VEFEYQEKPGYEAATRAFNISAALLGLILLAPLMLVIALAIKLSDPRAPILYRGRRIGKGGRPYFILKFRTMVSGAEQKIGGHLIGKGSPYITPLGKLLRRRKLDELPQLFNVLRGDMNLVGPRPAREVFLAELRQRIPGYDWRFLVRPGITGLAQVNGGYYTDPRNKLRYELLYIRHRSVWLDLKLTASTLFIIVSRALTLFGLLFLLLAFVIFVPTTFFPSLHVKVLGMRMNIAFLLIACLVGGWLIQSLLRRGFTLRRTPVDRYIAGFVLWAFLGALLNPEVRQNLLGVLYLCSGAFVLYFLATQAIEHDLEKIHFYVRGLGLIMVIVSLWGVLEYTVIGGVNGEEVRVNSVMGNPNVLALYLATMFPILLYLCLSCGGWHARLGWSAGALLGGACLTLTFSRSGYIAFSIAVLVFLSRWHRQLFYGVLALCIAVVVKAELDEDTRYSPRQAVTSPPALRMIQLYDSVLSNSQEDLLLGVGWRNWRANLDGAALAGDAILLGPVSSPRTLKNMYLTVLVEHGLVGLFLMLLIFVTTLETIYKGSYQVPEPSLRMLLWAILSGALGFMVNMLFFDSFYFIAVQAAFWLLLGFGTGITQEFEPASQRWYRVRQFHD
jgi:lipopolysaccharide/colanic/teichoic acid biosynthesis glycosyltransferase